MQEKKYISTLIFIIFSLSLLPLSVLLYIKYLWINLDYEQLLNTLHDLTPHVIRTNIYLNDYICGLLFFVLVWPIAAIKLNTKQQFYATLLIILVIAQLSGAIKYFYAIQTPSKIYETEYVIPNKEDIKLPQKPRNLIFIFLESFEQNFKYSQYYEANLIKNLSAMQTEGHYAKNYHPLTGTNYSIAALVAAHCAIPLRYLKERNIWDNKYFLPNAQCFPEILQHLGYQTKLIKAADIDFSRARLLATSHGYNEAIGINELKEKYPELKQEQYQGTFGGLTDRALFESAKKELAEFSPDAPFMLTLFSLDTHTPEHHQDKACAQRFNDLRDTFICTDSIVQDFLTWFEKTPYYKNTTIVIVGDHLLQARLKTKGHPQRGIYNVFLNLPPHLHINSSRHFSTLDIPATVLESLGIELKQHRFGLGYSLFNEEKTLAEKIPDSLNTKLMQPSKIYDQFSTSNDKQQLIYTPYILGTQLKHEDFLAYCNIYEKIIGAYYLDNLGFEFPSQPQKNLKVHLEFNALTEGKYTVTIYANQTKLLDFIPQKNQPLPYKIDFTIPQKLIKDNKLLLTFRNHKGNVTAAEMGIAPSLLQIEEQ